MKYMLLIYDREADWNSMTEAEQGAVFQEYLSFTEDLRRSGHFVAGDALQPVATATTVRVREGKTLTVDGPFAQTREQLGGFYVVEAKDHDEAIAIAARVPSARIGCVEVRPLLELPG